MLIKNIEFSKTPLSIRLRETVDRDLEDPRAARLNRMSYKKLHLPYLGMSTTYVPRTRTLAYEP